MIGRNTLLLLISLITGFISTACAQEPLYPSLDPGIHAPEVKGKNEKGKGISLSGIKSRITLLYFYEVHCHLCESMLPKLKELYEAYHKTGLEIVAIPVGAEKEDWTKYVAENRLPWKHLYPTKNVEAMKSNYLLTVSPTFYLIDKKHLLLTHRLGRVEQVEEALNIHIR
jgi:peroxiredoxin